MAEKRNQPQFPKNPVRNSSHQHNPTWIQNQVRFQIWFSPSCIAQQQNATKLSSRQSSQIKRECQTEKVKDRGNPLCPRSSRHGPKSCCQRCWQGSAIALHPTRCIVARFLPQAGAKEHNSRITIPIRKWHLVGRFWSASIGYRHHGNQDFGGRHGTFRNSSNICAMLASSLEMEETP